MSLMGEDKRYQAYQCEGGIISTLGYDSAQKAFDLLYPAQRNPAISDMIIVDTDTGGVQVTKGTIEPFKAKLGETTPQWKEVDSL